MSALKLVEKELNKTIFDYRNAHGAKRRLMHGVVDYITTVGTLGGGLLAAVALNALVGSLIERPDCHCYLTHKS